jgi:hypothetical protein
LEKEISKKTYSGTVAFSGDVQGPAGVESVVSGSLEETLVVHKHNGKEHATATFSGDLTGGRGGDISIPVDFTLKVMPTKLEKGHFHVSGSESGLDNGDASIDYKASVHLTHARLKEHLSADLTNVAVEINGAERHFSGSITGSGMFTALHHHHVAPVAETTTSTVADPDPSVSDTSTSAAAASSASDVTAVAATTGSATLVETGGVDTVVNISSTLGPTISIDPGTADHAYKFVGINGAVSALIGSASSPTHDGSTQLGANDTINVGDGTTATEVTAWVGANSFVNLAGNASTTIYVDGDVTGATSSGSYAQTTINLGTGAAAGTIGSLIVDMAQTGLTGPQYWASGFADKSYVDVSTATSLGNALDIAAAEALGQASHFNQGLGATIITSSGIQENAKTGLADWFQYGGNTYVVEAINSGSTPATHTALGVNDVVVELTGLHKLGETTVFFGA